MSPTHEKCLATAFCAGGRLYRWPGAWWTVRKYDPHLDCRAAVPEPHFHDLIVRGLLKRGLLEVRELMPRGGPCAVRVTMAA